MAPVKEASQTSYQAKPTPAQLNKSFSTQSAAQLKQMLEAEYEDRLQLLREQYDARLKSLHEQIAKIQDNISQDEIITAMKENATSSEYIGQRVKVLRFL